MSSDEEESAEFGTYVTSGDDSDDEGGSQHICPFISPSKFTINFFRKYLLISCTVVITTIFI